MWDSLQEAPRTHGLDILPPGNVPCPHPSRVEGEPPYLATGPCMYHQSTGQPASRTSAPGFLTWQGAWGLFWGKMSTNFSPSPAWLHVSTRHRMGSVMAVGWLQEPLLSKLGGINPLVSSDAPRAASVLKGHIWVQDFLQKSHQAEHGPQQPFPQ